MNEFLTNEWVWSKTHHESLKIIDINKQWNVLSYKLWSPSKNEVVIHSSNQIESISNATYTLEFLRYIISIARINHAYSTESIISPLQGNLIPLTQ